MPVELDGGVAVVTGAAGPDDAGTLGDWLFAGQAVAVDLGACSVLHGAALQVLLRRRPLLAALPPDPLVRQLLAGLGEHATR